MCDCETKSTTKFRFKPLKLFKSEDLVNIIINGKDENIKLNAWQILKNRELEYSFLNRIAKSSNNEVIAVEAYELYMQYLNPEPFIIYYISNPIVAVMAANNFLKQKKLEPRDLSKILYESKNEELAFVIFKEYCKRFKNDPFFDDFLLTNTIEGWCSNRHQNVANLAYSKLKKANLLSLDYMVKISIKGYSEKVSIAAAKELVIDNNVDFEKLYNVFLESKYNKVKDIVYCKMETLYLADKTIETKKMIFELLVNKKNYYFAPWSVKLWNLIQYSHFEENDYVLLLCKCTHEVAPLIWERHEFDNQMSSHNLYLIMTECKNREVSKNAIKHYLNHPDTSKQSIACILNNRSYLDSELIQLAISKLNKDDTGYSYKMTLLNLFQYYSQLTPELEFEIFELLKSQFELSEQFLLSITVFANSYKVSFEAYELYSKKVELTEQILTNLVLSCRNQKLVDLNLKLLFRNLKNEITKATLKALLNTNNTCLRQKLWSMYLKHPDVSLYDLQSMSKYHDSYTLKRLASEALNSPYYQSMLAYLE